MLNGQTDEYRIFIKKNAKFINQLIQKLIITHNQKFRINSIFI